MSLFVPLGVLSVCLSVFCLVVVSLSGGDGREDPEWSYGLDCTAASFTGAVQLSSLAFSPERPQAAKSANMVRMMRMCCGNSAADHSAGEWPVAWRILLPPWRFQHALQIAQGRLEKFEQPCLAPTYELCLVQPLVYL